MKKITYLMFMILGMVLMVGNVNADVTYGMDEAWNLQKDGKFCQNWDQEIRDTDARQKYSFDKSTGIFTVSGMNLDEYEKNGGGSSFTFFAVKDNGKTLVAYTQTWTNALKAGDGELPYDIMGQTPAITCDSLDDGVKMWKSSYPLSEIDDPSDDPSDEPSDDDPISDPDDDSTNGGSKTTKKTKTYTTSGGTQQTTNNPNTGISPFLSLPAILGGGIAIVLRKKRIFG